MVSANLSFERLYLHNGYKIRLSYSSPSAHGVWTLTLRPLNHGSYEVVDIENGHFDFFYTPPKAEKPPSTGMTVPVTKRLRSLHR